MEESPTTIKRDKLDFNRGGLIAQISPSTVRSSLMEQEFESSHQVVVPPLGGSGTMNNNNNNNNSSAHWIDFSADNDFQQMDNLFQQQQQQDEQQQQQDQHNYHGDDTSSIPVGSDVDLGGSLTEELDFGDEDDVKLDSEMVDDEQALQHMKELLDGKITSRTKQILLAAQQQATQRPPRPGTLNQRLTKSSTGIVPTSSSSSTSNGAPKPPRHNGSTPLDQTGDDSNHSDSRRGTTNSITMNTFQSSLSSGMSMSTDPAAAAAVDNEPQQQPSKKKSSKSKKKSKKSSSSEKRSDKKSSSKKKKKSSRSKDDNNDDDDHGFPSASYLPLDDDNDARVEDAFLPDGSIRLVLDNDSSKKSLHNNNSTSNPNGDSLIKFLHNSFSLETEKVL